MSSPQTKIRYVAFHRGINIGGHKKVPMAELRELYESLEFENVKTILNSGNVVFGAVKKTELSIVKEIEDAFQKKFGFESRTMIRAMTNLKKLVDTDPFRSVSVDKDVRLYVTFLREKQRSHLKLPYRAPGSDLLILQITDREVCSALTLKTSRSVDAMAFLEKEFGKDVTTRSWNTILKIVSF